MKRDLHISKKKNLFSYRISFHLFWLDADPNAALFILSMNTYRITETGQDFL